MWVLGAGSPDLRETRKPGEARTCPELAEDTSPIRVSPGKNWAQTGEQEREGQLLSMARSIQGSPPFQHTVTPEAHPSGASLPSVRKVQSSAQPRSQAQPQAPDTQIPPAPYESPDWDPKPSYQASPPLAFPTVPPKLDSGGQRCFLCQQKLPSLVWPEPDNILLN